MCKKYKPRGLILFHLFLMYLNDRGINEDYKRECSNIIKKSIIIIMLFQTVHYTHRTVIVSNECK